MSESFDPRVLVSRAREALNRLQDTVGDLSTVMEELERALAHYISLQEPDRRAQLQLRAFLLAAEELLSEHIPPIAEPLPEPPEQPADARIVNLGGIQRVEKSRSLSGLLSSDASLSTCRSAVCRPPAATA